MTIEARPGLAIAESAIQAKKIETDYRNGNSPENGNGRLPDDLIEHNGFIAVKATFLSEQPLDEVRRDLINKGVGDLSTQLRVIRRVDAARREIKQAKERLAIKPTSE